MTTIALEFVPPDLEAPDQEAGRSRAKATAERVRELLVCEGISHRINALLLPGMIAEEDDRPVPLRPKLDVLDLHSQVNEALALESIVTQVTAFSSHGELEARVRALQAAGVEKVVFVGVPRTLEDGAGPGLPPAEALQLYRDRLQACGVILIPTREDEAARFGAKLAAGANLALTQMLFSDHIGSVLRAIDSHVRAPEVLLSFAYVPKSEERIGLVHWLIRDTSSAARREMEVVREIAGLSFPAKKAALVEIFRRTVNSAREASFPLGLHFECPYDFNPYAIEVFHAMLDVWDAS